MLGLQAPQGRSYLPSRYYLQMWVLRFRILQISGLGFRIWECGFMLEEETWKH